jgi:predicted metal-dependent peptidase
MLLGRNELTEEERLSKAVVKIMGHPIYVALAGVVMIGTKTIDESTPTACTNGRDCKFGRKFIDKLTDAELRFVVLHEEYHKLYRHMTTWKHLWKIDAMLANCAMDYVINLKIVDENKPDYKGDVFAVPPQGVLLDERFRDMDTAQVFDILQSEQPPGDPEPDDSGDNESGDGGSGEGTGLGDGDDDGREPPTDAGFDEHDWEGAEALSEEDTKDLERDIDEAIRQGALTAGKAGGNGDRSFDDLLKVQVDWREVLREFVSNTCVGNDYATYARPNRRLLSQGVYMPSGISETIEELVLALDTSGSIGQREITVMLTEAASILETVKPNKVRVLYWGSDVVRDEVYEMHELDQMIDSTKPRGGGGTDVRCVTEYMRENNITPSAVVVLTDGYLFGGWGTWTCPVLWTILDNEHANPDVGKRVHIKARDM